MKIYARICPNCGAPLPSSSNGTSCVCEYCGSELDFASEDSADEGPNPEEADDDAQDTWEKDDGSQTESGGMGKRFAEECKGCLRFLLEPGNVDAKLKILIAFIIIIVLTQANISFIPLIFFVYIYRTIRKSRDEKKSHEKKYASFPKIALNYQGKNYMIILDSLREAGFKNIKCFSLRDLKAEGSAGANLVEAITADGEVPTGKSYPDDVRIVIYYHGPQVGTDKANGPGKNRNHVNRGYASGKAGSASGRAGNASGRAGNEPQPSGQSVMKNKWVALILCYFFGIFGVHKFYEGRTGMGFLYLFTLGLFGFGWIIDLFVLLAKPNPYEVKL